MKEAFKTRIESFWGANDTRTQLDYYLSQKQYQNLAIRIALEADKNTLSGFYDSLPSKNIFSQLGSLFEVISSFNGSGLQLDDFFHALLEQLESVPDFIQDSLDSLDQAEEAAKQLSSSIDSLDSAIRLRSSDNKVLRIYDKKEEAIQKIIQKTTQLVERQDFEKLQQHLTLLGMVKKIGVAHDRYWLMLRKNNPNLIVPSIILDKYAHRLPLDTCTRHVDELLKKKIVPKNSVQRKNIFRFLFLRTYLDGELSPEQAKSYRTLISEHTPLMRELSLKFLKEDSPITERLNKLHMMQCLFPPSALIDLLVAALEVLNAESEENQDRKMSCFLQAELQTPYPEVIRQELRQGYATHIQTASDLRSRTAERKVEIYMNTERHELALSTLTQSIKNGREWARNMLVDYFQELYPEFQKLEHGQQYSAVLSSIRSDDQGTVFDSLSRSIAHNDYDRAKMRLKQEGAEPLFDALAATYRSITLDYSLENPFDLLKEIKDRFRQGIQHEIQKLSHDVGSLIGDAISRSSASSTSGINEQEATNKIQELYQQYKDVILQQNPYEESTRKTLNDILSNAKALIMEADSIMDTESETIYQRILADSNNSLHRWLVGEPDNMQELVVALYLNEQNFIEKESKRSGTYLIVPEQLMMRHYANIISNLVVHEISVKNNPLILNLGDDFEQFLNFGRVPPDWYKEHEKHDKAVEIFDVPSLPPGKVILDDRFVIAHILDWIRFENEEALKVPFRKSMSVVCTRMTEAIVSCRRMADEQAKELKSVLSEMGCPESMFHVLDDLRKANYQISSLDMMKRTGQVNKNYDRSVEPKVRTFRESLMRQLDFMGQEAATTIRDYMKIIDSLDKSEFRIGLYLDQKERILKKYLTLNVHEMTRNHLKDTQKNSIQSKIYDSCIRVQQGINTRRSDMQSIRYSPILKNDNTKKLTPGGVLEMIKEFENSFPIIDRISGSRQSVDEHLLDFDTMQDATKNESILRFLERVERYLENAQKKARQLRIVIIPGTGMGSFEPTSFTLCIPMCCPMGKSRRLSVLSGLADYLYQTKFTSDYQDVEEEILKIVNKKSRSVIRPGTQDSKLKITDLIFREIAVLSGERGLPGNQPKISSLLLRCIIGSENTMIYRDLRVLSAPQKQTKFKKLREQFQMDRRGFPLEDGVLHAIDELHEKKKPAKDADKRNLTREFAHLNGSLQDLLLDNLYDLGVLCFHYQKITEAYQVFELVTKLNSRFPEAFWGLATAAHSPECKALQPTQRIASAIQAFREFVSFENTGPFWKKRARDIIKKLSDNFMN